MVGNAQRSGRQAPLHSLTTSVPVRWRPRPRIVALIAAHNEAAAIAYAIQSLQAQSWPPDAIVVVADNCTDCTGGLSLLHGVSVFHTAGNAARKAGALNQVLRNILDTLEGDDFVLAMDADSVLSRDWIRQAVRAIDSGKCEAACGAFHGMSGSGLVGQLQRNEYTRYARMVRRRSQVPVLSGTGSLFLVSALRAIAWERGYLLPGVPGEFYRTDSITEDNEITLALKALGYRCLCPVGCDTLTEVMPTWRDLFRQRLRWQTGALTDLRTYGLTRVTAPNWARQAAIYGAFVASIVVWGIIGASLARHLGVNLAWSVAVLAITTTERLWTVRRGGLKAVLLALAVLPEMGYDMFRLLFFFRSLHDAARRRQTSWNHVVRNVPDGAPDLRSAA
jgi:poly-beta-1,6-N-acetyl-D-glucosamine synthase